MYDLGGVGRRETVRRRHRDAVHVGHLEPRVGHPLGEGFAAQELEGDPGEPFLDAGVHHLDHVRVVDADASFALEARALGAGADAARQQHLDGDFAPLGIGGAIDDAHPAAAEDLAQLVPADLRALR